MTAKKRDHDLVQQYLPSLILNTIPGIIRELGDPYVPSTVRVASLN